MTFEQWCLSHNATPLALKTADVWCRGTLGQDAADVSALAFLEIARGAGGLIQLRYDGKHGGQHLRVREGTSAIAAHMAKLLKPETLQLNADIHSISKAHDVKSWIVSTASGKAYAARKLMLAIPTPAYKRINFQPSLQTLLPRDLATYVSSTRYGVSVKYIVLFATPFWRDVGSCGLAQSFSGPFNHCRDTSVDADGLYALMGFVTAGVARTWLQYDDERRKEEVLRQIGRLFGVEYTKVSDEFRGKMESEWQDDELAGWGCPVPVPGRGVLGAMEDGRLNSPLVAEQGLCLVGTEFVETWRGYMEGALRSGQNGARKVIAALSDGGSVGSNR
jgi:monoamine oxidase